MTEVTDNYFEFEVDIPVNEWIDLPKSFDEGAYGLWFYHTKDDENLLKLSFREATERECELLWLMILDSTYNQGDDRFSLDCRREECTDESFKCILADVRSSPKSSKIVQIKLKQACSASDRYTVRGLKYQEAGQVK